MPLPIGHSLMGYTLYDTFPRFEKGFSWRLLLLLLVVANLPDIDFLPGFFEGNPNKYHHHYLSHSIGAALIVASIMAGFLWVWQKRHFGYYFLIFASVYFSHIMLDYFTADTSVPYGVPMFWPVSSEYVMSPVSIFMSVHKVGRSDTFLSSLFVMHNLRVLLWEIAVFVPVITIVKLVKYRKVAYPGVSIMRDLDHDKNRTKEAEQVDRDE